MRRRTRAVAMAAAAALGTGAAMAAAAGDDDLKACVVKKTGELHAAPATGKCGRGAFAITIGGTAFKKGARGGTLTINGVAFKRRGQTLTINGTAFKGSARGQTLTINGTAFKGSARGQTLTINGTAFRTSTLPNVLTINGVTFEGGGQTLTINGTTFAPGPAPASGSPGPPGPQGAQGPPGPATTLAGPRPAEVAGPVAVKAGAGRVMLAAAPFSGSESRRLLVAGGFSAACNGCAGAVDATWALERDGAVVLQRRMNRLSGDEATGVGLSEVVVTPGACSPCEFRLVATAAGAAGGGGQVDVTDIRLGLVDLGVVGG